MVVDDIVFEADIKIFEKALTDKLHLFVSENAFHSFNFLQSVDNSV